MIRRSGFTRLLNAHALMRLTITTSLAFAAVGALSIFASHGADAGQGVLGGCPNTNGLNELPNVYCNAAIGWLDTALQNATRFFSLLVGIEFAWTLILWTLQKDNLGELVSALVIKTMGISFFYFLLLNKGTSDFLPKIMQSFMQLGGVVSGHPVDLNNPTGIFEIGTAICRMVFAYMPWANFYFDVGNVSNSIYDDLFMALAMLAAGIFAVVIALVVFIAFLMVAGELIMTLIEAYVMVGGGAVLLGFTGSRWTMSFGEKWFGYAFAIGIKLFVISMIVGLGSQLFPTDCGTTDGIGVCSALNDLHATRFYRAADFYSKVPQMMIDYLIIGSTAIIFMMLTTKLPGLASSMLNGSPSLTMGSAMSALSSIAGAVTGGLSAATSTAMGSLDAVMGAAGGVLDAGTSASSTLMDNAKEAAMMAAGGGMGGGAAAAGGGMGGGVAAAGGGMPGVGDVIGGAAGGGGGMPGGGATAGGAGMPGGGAPTGGSKNDSSGAKSSSSQSIPGSSMMQKNSAMVVAKGFAEAGMAVGAGVKNVGIAAATGAKDLATAMSSPLMSMDQGGGGDNNVSIGLKLPA